MSGMDVGGVMRHLGKVFDAQDRAEEGRYCGCAEPVQVGTICTDCGCCIRSIEVEQVLDIVRAHDFRPHSRHPEMCDQCSNWADHPRHHGQSDIGRLRDGTPVDPAHYPAAPAYPQIGGES